MVCPRLYPHEEGVRDRRSTGPASSLACGNQRKQFHPHGIQNAPIFAGFALPEQTHGRIPRAVVAIEQPAIVRRIRQQDPGWAPEGSGEMGDAGVYRDHQVKT